MGQLPNIPESLGDVAESDNAVDLLFGMQDFSHGQALTYFGNLDESDREMTQWYLSQGIGPWQIEGYVGDLVKGYAIADPDRRYKDGMNAAHAELDRLNRFLQIFMESRDYFPWLELFNVSIRGVDGAHEGSMGVIGWSRFGGPKGSAMDLRQHQESIQSYDMKGYIDSAMSFIDNASSVPGIFNQDSILAQSKNESLDLSL